MELYLIILGAIILVLLSLLILMVFKYLKVRNKLYEENSLFQYNKSKISMIEYQYRNFREGENPYTVMRKISDILKDFEA